jgi:hypothetical protein
MNQIPQQPRILAISLSTRGFGYAVTEGNDMIIACGNTRIYGDKNAGSLVAIEKIIVRYQPGLIVLQDVKVARRDQRIKRLHNKILALAAKHKIKAAEISAKELRLALLGRENGTKHDLAEHLAKRFPDELASRLPPQRRAWMNADYRMDIFDAVGLAVAFGLKRLIGLHILKKKIV